MTTLPVPHKSGWNVFPAASLAEVLSLKSGMLVAYSFMNGVDDCPLCRHSPDPSIRVRYLTEVWPHGILTLYHLNPQNFSLTTAARFRIMLTL